MGTSRSWGEVDRKLTKLAKEYADLPASQVKESALIAKKSVQTFMPERLRGVGRRGARLTVRYDVMGSGQASSARVYVKGPAQLIERDTKAHRIPRERGGRRRYAVIPGVGVRAYANHPGTKGKHPWAKGVAAAQPAITRLFETKGALALRRIF